MSDSKVRKIYTTFRCLEYSEEAEVARMYGFGISWKRKNCIDYEILTKDEYRRFMDELDHRGLLGI